MKEVQRYQHLDSKLKRLIFNEFYQVYRTIFKALREAEAGLRWLSSNGLYYDGQGSLLHTSLHFYLLKYSITEGFRRCFGEIQQMAFLPSPAVPLFIGGTRLLAGRTPSVGFQTLIFVWRENNTL